MRLVEVQEREYFRIGLPIDPAGERIDRRPAIALRVGQEFSVAGHLDRIVEEIEACGDPGLMAKHVRGHRRAGRVAGGFEPRRERLDARLQRVADVVANAVMGRQLSGEERCVRRQGERRVTVDVVEHERGASEPIEFRSRALTVAVERQAIGAQRVDGNQDDRRIAVLRDRCSRPTRARQENGQRGHAE